MNFGPISCETWHLVDWKSGSSLLMNGKIVPLGDTLPFLGKVGGHGDDTIIVPGKSRTTTATIHCHLFSISGVKMTSPLSFSPFDLKLN